MHDAPRHTRVVIVTAEVGEGHAAAARALAAGLAAESPDAEVVICDALDGLGRFLRLILLDAYRWQLRVAPWVFGILYAVSRRFAPARRLGAAVLAALGARPLLRLVARHQPTVVVSTYPAATIVLGQLRRRGRLSVPVYATITDLAGVAFWAHRGIDLHLVMHESCIAGVERVAGRDSARRVRPLVAPEFFEPRSRREARGALALPQDGTIIVVSGGGWAVGDLRGAVRAALAIGGATVLALAGREAAVRRRLEREFADELRVRVLGFTDRMSDLLSAADALVHSTGGVTCLEALVCGCPTIAYGAPPGHAPLNARVMGSLGLVETARSSAELQRALARALDRPAARAEVASLPTAAALVASAVSRSPAKPVPPRRVPRTALAGAVLASVAGLALSTDGAYAVAARVLELEPMTRVVGVRPEVALVVRVPAPTVPAVIEALAGANGRASFAISGDVGEKTLARLNRAHDRPLPELHSGTFGDWLVTKRRLREEARVYGLADPFFYLAPDEFTVGAYLLARDLGGRPVSGAVDLGAASVLRGASFRRGDVVVLTLPRGADGATRLVRQVLRALARSHLEARPLPQPAPSGDAR